MEKYIYFPSKELEFSLKKKIPFEYQNRSFLSIEEFVKGNSKSFPECDLINLQNAEKGLIEMLIQNKELRDRVLCNKEYDFAYSLAQDKDWGIGFAKNDSEARSKKNWKGKNYFGDIMTKVRKYLLENPQIYAKNQYHGSKSNSNVKDEHLFDWRVISKNIKEKFTYFWRADSAFSQHHLTKFTLDGHTFNCAEQYYMYMKADTFKDDNSKLKILKNDNPMKQKSIGRGVYNFNADIWDKKAKDVVFKGNVAKFSQNSRILKLLLMTDGTTLVEASPKDDKWGVNLEAHDVKIFHRQTWKGTNWLGETLTKVRQHFIDKGMQSDYNFEYLKPDCYISFTKSASPFHYAHMCFFEVDGVPYSSLNHYLVHMAAELFDEVKIIDEIKSCYCNNKLNNLYCSINKFNEVVYNRHLNKYLLIGNYHKFIQNTNLLGQLLDTAGCIIVFKDNDNSLGNGNNSFEEEEILKDNWTGKNLLGYSLTYMRDQYLKSNGTYRPGETIDFSMYQQISAVPYSKSQNYSKKMEANKYIIDPSSSHDALSYYPQTSNINASKGGGGQSNKKYNKYISNNNQHFKNYDTQKNNFNENIHDTKRAKIDDHSNRQFNVDMNTFKNLNCSSVEQLNKEDLNSSKQSDPFENGEDAFVINKQVKKNLSSEYYDNDNIKLEDNGFSTFDNLTAVNQFESCKNYDENIEEKLENNKNFETTKYNDLNVHVDVENYFEHNKNQTSTQNINNLENNLNANATVLNLSDNQQFSNINIEKPINEIKKFEEQKKCPDKKEITLKVNDGFLFIHDNIIIFDKDSIFSLISNHPIQINNLEYPTVNHYIYWKRADIYKFENFKKDILELVKSIALNKKFDKEFKYHNLKLDNPIDLNIWHDEAEAILMEANLEKVNKYDDIKKKLLETKGYELKYSSHSDPYNIIGVGKDLIGENLLGKVLMKIRDDILKQI